jgi:hypothetical protein
MKKLLPSKRQHSTGELEQTEKKAYEGAWADTYINTLSMKETAISIWGIERLSKHLVEWARTEDAFTLTDFFELTGIPHGTFNVWVSRYDILAVAHNTAKELIGARREKNVATGKWKDAMIRPVQGHYSHVWRSEQERQAHLEQSTSAPGTQFVVIEKMPDTKEVPEKK